MIKSRWVNDGNVMIYNEVKELIEDVLRNHLTTDLDILTATEYAVYKAVDQHVRCNQAKGSRLLGVSRGCYRAKLKKHGLLEE